MQTRQGDGFARCGFDLEIEVDRIGFDTAHRTAGAVVLAGDDAHLIAVGGGHEGDLMGPNVLIARRRHLGVGRQIDPQLEAPHEPVFLLRHFGMQDAASGRHPLHAAGLEQTAIALVVAVTHASGEHVGDGLEAAMRVLGEAADVVVRIVGQEFVEQQKGIEFRQGLAADDAEQPHAGTVGSGLALYDARHRAV